VEVKRNFADYFPISLINEICKDVTGDGYSTEVKEAVDACTKIVFSRTNACWLLHMTDHTLPPTEVLLSTATAASSSAADDAYVVTTDPIAPETSHALCMETIVPYATALVQTRSMTA